MKINDGGPAFPRTASELPNDECSWNQEGMSMRRYYAAKAMQVLLYHCCELIIREPKTSEVLAPATAKGAFDIADAMIAFEENEAKGEKV